MWRCYLTQFDMGFFGTFSLEGGGGGGGHDGPYNFLVYAPMIMKFGTDIELDVLYTTVTKTFVTSL